MVEKYMPKTAVLQLFHNQNPKCAIFSKENMILIKDRHCIAGGRTTQHDIGEI